MAVLLARTKTVDCSACGETSDAPVWVAIDLAQRPELRDVVADPATYTHRCHACGHEQPRREPIAVTNLDRAAPMLIGEGARPGPRQRAQAEQLLMYLDAALRESPIPTPEPPVACPFGVLRAAAGRDVTADLRSIGRAVREVEAAWPRLGKDYRGFLNALAETAPRRDRSRAIEHLHRASTLDGVDETLAAFPELRSEAVRVQLDRDARELGPEEQRRFVRAELELLDAHRRGDLGGAGERYLQAQREIHDAVLLPELARLLERFDAIAEHDHATVVTVGEQVIEHAHRLAQTGVEALASLRTAFSHLESYAPDRDAHVQRGIDLLERADELLVADPEVGEQRDRLVVLLNLAAAYGARAQFDPVANQRRAIEIAERLLATVSIEDDGELWAKTHTNLGNSLLVLAQATDDYAEDGQLRALDEILGHFVAALEWRSFERDALDWAYTQHGIGAALANSGRHELALPHFDAAERGFAAAADEAHRMQAVNARASARISIARRPETPSDHRAELFIEAMSDARTSAEWLSKHGDAVAAGEAWWQLSRAAIAHRQGAPIAASALMNCLEHWTPRTAPASCLRAAEALALLAERGGDDDVAAAAWRTVADSAVEVIARRASREDRLIALGRDGDAFRRAAVGLVRANHLEAAVEVLELGRARELAAWLDRDVIELGAVRLLAPALADEYEHLRQQIDTTQVQRVAAGDVGFAHVVERLERVIEAIRALPGQESFQRRATLATSMAGARPGEPIAFPLLGDDGASWLVIESGTSPRVTRLELHGLTHESVAAIVDRHLDALEDLDALDGHLAVVSDVLGDALMAPLAAELARRGATEVCVIGLGLLGLLPLHALTWLEAGDRVCLLDGVTVSYAPSLFSRLVCARRAEARTGTVGTLVCVADPTDVLDFAEAEARIVGDVLGATPVLLLREAATKAAVAAAVAGATHVHFACHGKAAIATDAMDSALWLADAEPLAAREVVQLDLGAARLVVISACESGVISDNAADEALAIGSVMIGAGAAGVVSSLWEVGDRATAILMSRFYIELAGGVAPAAALQAAALWLRGLTGEELRSLEQEHPGLQNMAEDEAETARPFAAPSAWAAFIFSGA